MATRRRFRFDLSDFRRAAKAAQKIVPQKIRMRRFQFITGAVKLFESGFKETAPSFQGGLINSTGTSVEEFDGRALGSVFVQGQPAIYVDVLDEGRKPGTFPNVGAIQRWTDLKIKRGDIRPNVKTLFPGRKTRPSQAQVVRSLAFLIGRKIKRKGTKALNFIDKAIKLKRRPVQELADKFAQLLSKDVEDAIGR